MSTPIRTVPPGRGRVRSSEWMLERLPERMRDDDLLCRLVTVFQLISDSLIEHADQLEHDVDPTVAPSDMVTLLAEWIGLDFIDPTLDDLARRRIVLTLAASTGWSGTCRALSDLLETITAGSVEIVDSGGVFRAGHAPSDRSPHVDIRVESSGWLTPGQLREVVHRELPVSVTCTLSIGDEVVDPASTSGGRTSPTSSVECPQCGVPVSPSDGNWRSADDFCPVCDYPLFWLPARDERPSDDPSGWGRLPGVSGRAGLEAWPCPSCAEPNPQWADTCTRCGATMAAAPPPPPPEPIEPLPVPIVEAAPPVLGSSSSWNPLARALTAATVVLVLVVTLVILL